MLKENYNSPCEFAEQMIAYFYDEASADETNKFAAHLKNCAACADELASFGLIRSSVLEWREADFDSLPTPNFDLSAITGAKPQLVVETEKPKSRFADFWTNWIFNPTFATAAVLLLFVGVGIFIYSRQSSNEKNFAAMPNESNGKITVSPTAAKIREESSENKITEPDKNQEISVNKPLKSLEFSNVKQNAPVEKSDGANPPVKVSTKLPKNKSINSEVAVETEIGVRKAATVKRTKAPTLTNNDDEEDDSVRLSDLFAEIDTK